MVELWHYQFFLHAMAAIGLGSIVCGVIGTYIVSRRMVFIAGGITHSAFGGIGLAWYLGFPPLLGATLVAVAVSLITEHSIQHREFRQDTMIGILWSIGMAFGIVFVSQTPGYAPNLMSYLFGNILLVSQFDLYFMSGLAGLVILINWACYRQIIYTAFDREFMLTRGVAVKTIQVVMSILIALTIVIMIRIAGIMLVISLLTIPQTTANLFFRSYKKIVVASILLALVSGLGGLVGAYYWNLPTGAAIIIFATLVYLLAKLAKTGFRLWKKVDHE